MHLRAVLPEPGGRSPYQARGLRGMDLAMLEFHNAKERDVEAIGYISLAGLTGGSIY